MNIVNFTIDGKQIFAPAGRKVLWIALEEGFYIPHLCALEEMNIPYGGCRMCFVEVEGIEEPVLSCNLSAEDGLAIRTDTPQARKLQKRAFELLLSNHPLPCKGCHAHGKCSLQEIALHLHFKLAHPRLEKINKTYPVDSSHPKIIFDPNYCILCGLCVYMCNEVEKARAINFERRGIETKVGTFKNIPLSQTSCTGCMKCVNVCPVGAFRRKEENC